MGLELLRRSADFARAPRMASPGTRCGSTRALCGDLRKRAPPSEVLGLDVSPLLLIQMGLLFAGGTGRAARRSTRLLGLWRRSWALGAAGSCPKIVWLEKRWSRGAAGSWARCARRRGLSPTALAGAG